MHNEVGTCAEILPNYFPSYERSEKDGKFFLSFGSLA